MSGYQLNKKSSSKAKVAQYFVGSENKEASDILETLKTISILTLALLILIIALLVYTILTS